MKSFRAITMRSQGWAVAGIVGLMMAAPRVAKAGQWQISGDMSQTDGSTTITTSRRTTPIAWANCFSWEGNTLWVTGFDGAAAEQQGQAASASMSSTGKVVFKFHWLPAWGVIYLPRLRRCR